MKHMNNEDYAIEYTTTWGLKNSYYKKILRIYNHYSNYQKMTLHELLTEADTEEEAGVRWKRRTLKKRLVNYTNYCKQNMLLSSATTYINTIKSWYTHNEIEIGPLPRINKKNANLSEPVTSKDMLTKEIIREALKVANPVMRCIILTEASSGMTKSDVMSLTVGQFLEATRPYHDRDNIQEAVSPEATTEICKYLRLRDKRNHKYHRPLLTDVDQLFKISGGNYQDKFNEINNQLNRGKAGTYNQFRGHMLRKWHATQLEKQGMSRYLVKTLQGKSNNAVDDVYFIEDETTLRDEYLKALDGVLIYTDVKEVTKYSPEYQKLERENLLLKEQTRKIDILWKEFQDKENRDSIWEQMKRRS